MSSTVEPVEDWSRALHSEWERASREDRAQHEEPAE